MPFGLKNAGATYERFMDKMFKNQKERNIEVYADDLVIKGETERAKMEDIVETFKTLRGANMILNLGKYFFRVEEGKFLGVWVTKNGNRANPEKIKAVMEMKSPWTLKEVQILNGRLIALNRFLSKIP